jgi:hypothetical protein
VAVNVSPKFALVGEATFMGGVRIRAPQRRAIVPFGQVLFGGEHDTSTFERTTQYSQRPSTCRSESGSSNAVLALDSGVTMMAGVIAVRASAGYVRMFGRADAHAFRLSLGAGFRF